METNNGKQILNALKILWNLEGCKLYIILNEKILTED